MTSLRAIGLSHPRAETMRSAPASMPRIPSAAYAAYASFGNAPAPASGHFSSLSYVFLKFDFDVDAGWKIELHQAVNGLGRGVDDVEEALVGAHLELLAGRLVDVGDRRTVHRLMIVGSSTGPVTRAPVRRTVSTISLTERSRR